MVRAASSARTPAGDRSSSARVTPKATRAGDPPAGAEGSTRRTSSRSVRPLTRRSRRTRGCARGDCIDERVHAPGIDEPGRCREDREAAIPERHPALPDLEHPSTAGAAVGALDGKVPPTWEAVRFRTTRLSSSLTAIRSGSGARRPASRPPTPAAGRRRAQLARVQPPHQAELPWSSPRGAAGQLQIAVPDGREAVERRRGDALSLESDAIGPSPMPASAASPLAVRVPPPRTPRASTRRRPAGDAVSRAWISRTGSA